MSKEENTAMERQHLVEWQEHLQDAIDGALTASESAAINAHLVTCSICTAEQQRLLALEAQLRGEFSVAPTPSANFDQRLFASIAALEQNKLTLARQREQQEFATRLTQLRGSWRTLLQFHLGNIIGSVAVAGAVVMAIAAARPMIAKNWIGIQGISWLPRGWIAALPAISGPMGTVIASAGIAAAAIWITRRIDRHPD